jgi:hypothetical protein
MQQEPRDEGGIPRSIWIVGLGGGIVLLLFCAWMGVLLRQSDQPTPCFTRPTLAEVAWYSEAYDVGLPAFPADGPQLVPEPPYLIVRNSSPVPLYVLNPGSRPHPDWAPFWMQEVGLPLTDDVAGSSKFQNDTLLRPVITDSPLSVEWVTSSAAGGEAYVDMTDAALTPLNPRGPGRPANAQPPALQHTAVRMIYDSVVYTIPVSIAYTLNSTYTTIAKTPITKPANLPDCASLGDYRPGGLGFMVMALMASGIYGIVMIVLLLSHYAMCRE